jgi:hypothetical protein
MSHRLRKTDVASFFSCLCASKKLELKPEASIWRVSVVLPRAISLRVGISLKLAAKTMTRFLALTLAALLGAAASVAAFAPAPGAAAARPSAAAASKTSLAYGYNYGVMDGDDQYYRGTDRYGRSGYGGYGGGYGRSGYNDDYYRGGYRTERLSDVGKVS